MAFVVLYRWRLHPGLEETFIEAWSSVTEKLRARGSLGSRLHRGSDGIWYSYAQWPSEQARRDAFVNGPIDTDASAKMKTAIAERFEEVTLEITRDYLASLSKEAREDSMGL